MRIEGKKLKKVSNKVNILESIDISITSDIYIWLTRSKWSR